MTFGQVLRLLRKECRMTQKQLADVFKISESTIGMYERDQREPSFEMQEAFADYFNVDMDYLMGRSDIRRVISYSENPFSVVHHLTPRQAELIALIDRLPPEEQDSVIQRLEDIVQLLLSRDPR